MTPFPDWANNAYSCPTDQEQQYRIKSENDDDQKYSPCILNKGGIERKGRCKPGVKMP